VAILPINTYKKHENELVSDVKARVAFKLLSGDPESRPILYFHGAAGTLGSGWRLPSYRALYATAPDKIHTVAIDYRGFGSSKGTPP
jgi:abhydrolase domain-containing protein 12